MPPAAWSEKGTVEERPWVSLNYSEWSIWAILRWKSMLASEAKMSRAPTPAALFDDFIRGPWGGCLSLNYSQRSICEIACVDELGANSKSIVLPEPNAHPKGPKIGPVGHCAYSLSGEHIFWARNGKFIAFPVSSEKLSFSGQIRKLWCA